MSDLAFVKEINFTQVLSNPILDIGARLWEEDRYEAFKITYISMRVMDDLVDEPKASEVGMSDAEKREMAEMINSWVGALKSRRPIDPTQKLLLETVESFQIPLWPWQKLAESMIYDLYNDGFKDFPAFLRYSEGAAVAPGSIFMHLCGVVKENGIYRAPNFNIQEAARPLALFSYLVHVIRDFQKDQNNNLNYLAESKMAENGLTRNILKKIASGGEIPAGFRSLVKDYYQSTDYYRGEARSIIDDMKTILEPRYWCSLEMIYSLYLQIFERIDVGNGQFTTDEMIPTPAEVEDRINLTMASFGFTH